MSLWHEGRLLLDYTPAPEKIERIPEPAQEAADPEKIASLEELLLTGLHLEQYRHATYAPDPYYLEGLRRDPDDSRLNNAYGMLLMRRGRFEEAEKHFRAAVKRLTWRNPNPYDSEPYLNLGMALRWQERYDEAFDAFYKATWTSAQQEAAFYELAAIAARRGEWSRRWALRTRRWLRTRTTSRRARSGGCCSRAWDAKRKRMPGLRKTCGWTRLTMPPACWRRA